MERAWQASPLASLNVIDTCLSIAHESVAGSATGHDRRFVVALSFAADQLLSAEDVEEATPKWSMIESDASAAIEFRAALRRRRQWALDYHEHMAVFRHRLVGGYRSLIEALPESWLELREDEDAPFSVPLSSLLYDPAETIERLLMVAYDDETLRLDLFHALRQWFAGRLVIASGFAPGTDPDAIADRIVMPTRHRSENASELVELYLGGSPFEGILNTPVPFRVPTELRFEHAHVVGGTGHGKTQLLQRMIYADLIAAKEDGRSVVVIDSQGDLIQKLVRLDIFDPDACGSLADRLVVIDPSDVEFPPALNLFDIDSERYEEYRPADRERALNGLIELYETFFGALLGAELTQKQGVIFRYLARLMLAIPEATIHTLMLLMEDGNAFRPHMERLDGSARYFFETEFFHSSFSATKKQILKRLWGVLSTPAFERMFAQKTRKLDLFEATNGGKIVLINTAKDLLKTEGSALFGRFFISMIAQAALERSALAEWQRTPTFVYVDEAQEYFDDAIETILSQARKYKVGITMAHQTLDQLTPRLRAAFLSNSSLKCAGGVSSRDARALASELHTAPEFIEGMRKRTDRTEFAVWLKGRTPRALRMDVPLGFLERQPTLSEDSYDALIDQNRARYCGTRADVLAFPSTPRAARLLTDRDAGEIAADAPAPLRASDPEHAIDRVIPERVSRTPPAVERGLGKGGPKHRYLQSLVKELAEQQGFRATLEAPLPSGTGQVDVLIARDELRVAFEVSVTTPVEQERENIRKCLDAGFSRVALVLAKSRATQGRYRSLLSDTLSSEERERLSFLAPEELPDYIALLLPAPPPSESMVKGYRVRVSRTAVSPDDAKERRDRLAKLVARSLRAGEE